MTPGDYGESEIVNESRALTLMSDFTRVFRETVPQLNAEFGEEKASEFVDQLKFKIESQLFNLAPLNREYYLSKLKNKLDPRTLIATRAYLNGILYERVEDTSGVVFRCGVARGVHAPSGLPLATLQKYLENGTSRMPARPHWGPEIRLFKNRSSELAGEYRDRLVRRVAANMS